MHLTSVVEYRSSQTCSRCFNETSLSAAAAGVHKLKQCMQGGLHGGHNRQQQQQHNPRLVLDRDVNAARVLAARLVYDLFPDWMLDQGQLLQLKSCLIPRQ